MERLKECQIYIKRWYLGEPVLAVRMAADEGDEIIIQYLVVEVLRDLLDNPPPDSFIEGTSPLNLWVAHALKRAMEGVDIALEAAHVDSIKNLAWNYFVDGITKTQKQLGVENRLYKTARQRSVN